MLHSVTTNIKESTVEYILQSKRLFFCFLFSFHSEFGGPCYLFFLCNCNRSVNAGVKQFCSGPLVQTTSACSLKHNLMSASTYQKKPNIQHYYHSTVWTLSIGTFTRLHLKISIVICKTLEYPKSINRGKQRWTCSFHREFTGRRMVTFQQANIAFFFKFLQPIPTGISKISFVMFLGKIQP